MEAQPASSIDSPVNFDRPPVGEVALAVQFGSPVADDALTLGRFWPRIQAEYPDVERQPPVPPMAEDFEVSAAPTVSFQLLDPTVGSRYWLSSKDGTELIQVQGDRFVYNWRKDPTDAPYPRYRHLRERFVSAYSTLRELLAEDGREPVATWCEVTYINPIDASDGSGGRRDLSEILGRLAPQDLTSLPSPEDMSYAERFILERGGERIGRFHVNAASAISTTDQTPIYLVTLTARGRPPTPDNEGILDFLDSGRGLVVNGFREMTTPEMHELWGLRDDTS